MNISCSKGTDSNLETSGILQSYGIQYIQIKYLQATAANSTICSGPRLSPFHAYPHNGTRSRNFGRQANAWARTSTPAGQHTCVTYRPPAKSSGWPRGLHLQPHHARVIKLQKVSRLISGLVWLHTFSFTGGTLLQLSPCPHCDFPS